MAKDHIRDYDLTAGNNTDVDGVSVAEGTAPSNINDAIREVMAHQAELHGDTRGGLTSGGSGGAYTITTNESLTAYAQSGGLFVWEANHTMPATATVSLNFDSVGAKPMRKHVSVVLSENDILANQMVITAYEAANDVFHVLSVLGRNVDPITTQGDIITGDASNTPQRVAVGAAETILQSDGTDPGWVDPRASQAEQETGTDTTQYVTSGRQQYHPSASKAWAVWGVDAVLDAGYNIASITDNGAGDWTINFTTAFSSADYVVVTGHETSRAEDRNIEVHTKAVGSVGIRVVDNNGSTTEVGTTTVSIACFGDQ